eukprot:CAMPEP_0183578328 /NCGR_PEP_ID=MMETSP0371-20130417/141593_1 /TAXON_ID=268820 /ORGANISM="Peridinium aciculiferum, Strain PAER-2" /LENGTH=73 /DNA_ID=CAMNT_0025788741 /DNA_START=962 /DNA_END=1180 /DNA_ORIENTATION=-
MAPCGKHCLRGTTRAEAACEAIEPPNNSQLDSTDALLITPSVKALCSMPLPKLPATDGGTEGGPNIGLLRRLE